MKRDDSALFEAWQQGDMVAGSELLTRHLPSLRAYFATRVQTGVDDLVQSTVLGCVEGRPRLRDVSRFRGYLFGIARYQLLGRFREHRRESSAPCSPPTPSRSPCCLVQERQELGALKHALQELPTDSKDVLELFYWEHMSTDDMANRLGVPRGTVKSRLIRARALLRDRVTRGEAPVQRKWPPRQMRACA